MQHRNPAHQNGFPVPENEIPEPEYHLPATESNVAATVSNFPLQLSAIFDQGIGRHCLFCDVCDAPGDLSFREHRNFPSLHRIVQAQ
jgi:hypothetical protein